MKASYKLACDPSTYTVGFAVPDPSQASFELAYPKGTRPVSV